MADCILALDAGGTSIKACLMGMDCVPIHADALQHTMHREGGEQVLAAFAEAAECAKEQANAWGMHIAMVGVCCPGPFDFAKGMSRMVHKWQDAYEKPLAPVLRSLLGNVPVHFLHDSSAFLLGEAYRGTECMHENMAGVMLGTGFGFGYMQRGRVQIDHLLGPRIRLWNQPFRDGSVEDFVSRRAIRARYAQLAGIRDAAEDTPDVHELAMAAQHGDAAAIRTFAQTGALLGEILSQVVPGLGCDLIVLGGQIARSAPLFLPFAELELPIVVATHTEDAALRGIATYCMQGHAKTMEAMNP